VGEAYEPGAVDGVLPPLDGFFMLRRIRIVGIEEEIQVGYNDGWSSSSVSWSSRESAI